jgi:hypothetical protein
MAKKLNEAQMIEALNKRFKEVGAVPVSEFYGDKEQQGIWLKGSESGNINGLPVFDTYELLDTMGVNPTLDAFLTEHGWCAEPYDNGTLHLFKNF